MSRDEAIGFSSVALNRRGAVRLISAVALGLGARIAAAPVLAETGEDVAPPEDGCDDVTEPAEPGEEPVPTDPEGPDDSYGGADTYRATGADGELPTDGGDSYSDGCGDDLPMPISAPPPGLGDSREKGKHRRKNRKRKNRRRNRR